MTTTDSRCSRTRRAWRIALLAATLTGGLALLIWTKLRLVTGVPKTAYADPEKDKPAAGADPAQAANPSPR